MYQTTREFSRWYTSTTSYLISFRLCLYKLYSFSVTLGKKEYQISYT